MNVDTSFLPEYKKMEDVHIKLFLSIFLISPLIGIFLWAILSGYIILGALVLLIFYITPPHLCRENDEK